MNVLLKSINYFVTFVLFITLIFTFYLVISSKLIGEDMNLFGYQIKTVLSGSMEPDIKVGSIILIKTDGDSTRFQTGDVITYMAEENIPVTHRITQVKSDGQEYITKGDANDGVDIDPVPAENIIGEYSGFTVPYVGYLLTFATSNQGIALFLIVPGILLFIRSIVIFWKVSQYATRLKNEINTNTD